MGSAGSQVGQNEKYKKSQRFNENQTLGTKGRASFPSSIVAATLQQSVDIRTVCGNLPVVSLFPVRSTEKESGCKKKRGREMHELSSAESPPPTDCPLSVHDSALRGAAARRQETPMERLGFQPLGESGESCRRLVAGAEELVERKTKAEQRERGMKG